VEIRNLEAARNPYAPGAGTRPPLLAGRDDLVAQATLSLERAKRRLHGKSFVAVGLRGVGKTVVLNKVQELAEDDNYVVVYIEAHDDASLASLLVPKLRQALIRISRVEQAAELARKGLVVLKNFANAVDVKMGGIEVGLDFGDEDGTADSGDLENDLPELFQIIGEAAAARDTAIAILVDEMQYLTITEMSALVMAMHRANQRALPIVLIGAGLPPLLGKMGESKSYAERLFDFPRVETLDHENACLAIAEPARKGGVEFESEALDEIFDVTRGYPYFLQEWAYVAWNSAEQSPITRETILACRAEAIRRLDESFFRVRLERMTPTERRYMFAMASLGAGPHSSGDISKEYGAKVSTVAPTRSSLIAKGMLYSPSYGSTDFTVPLFDEFIRREMPEWKNYTARHTAQTVPTRGHACAPAPPDRRPRRPLRPTGRSAGRCRGAARTPGPGRDRRSPA
jgi:type II secretory pathway predicted ATPase ExeA